MRREANKIYIIQGEGPHVPRACFASCLDCCFSGLGLLRLPFLLPSPGSQGQQVLRVSGHRGRGGSAGSDAGTMFLPARLSWGRGFSLARGRVWPWS